MSETASKSLMVIEVGGKQHLAGAGSQFVVSGITAKAGEAVKAKELLSGKEITLKVLKNFLGEKVNGLKFKNKVRYTRRYGHRQQLALVEVAAAKAEPKKAPAVKPAAKAATKKTAGKK